MDRIFVLSTFIILFLTMGSAAGCGWMGILDTNPYDDGITKEDRRYCEDYISQFRIDLLGLSKRDFE